MNIFKFDSPVMEFIGKVADMICLNLLWLICSIPVVTIGAATSAKYVVAMRILRNEQTPVFKPFFKAFAENFKQSTIIWLILMIPIAICSLDWLWIYNQGFSNVSGYYRLAMAAASMFVVGMCMCIFPFIGRFSVATKEAFKAAFVMTFLHYFQLLLIVLLEVGTIIACLWYASWLIAVALFGTTSAFYFNCLLMVKEFKKMEENL